MQRWQIGEYLIWRMFNQKKLLKSDVEVEEMQGRF
jgi:hypothetical protein